VRYVNEGVFRPRKPKTITGLFHSFIRPGQKKIIFSDLSKNTKALLKKKPIID